MLLKFEKRPEASELMRYVSPLLSIVLTLACGFVLFGLLGKDPIKAFEIFFINPLKTSYGISELFLKATPLILIATGLSIGFRANVWNIGAEGQFILGAIAATGVAIHFDYHPKMLLLTEMAIAGMLGGMLWAGITAYLRTRFNTNEILVSLMLVYVAQYLAEWFVQGPWKDPEGFGFPQTVLFSETALLPTLFEGLRVNLSLLATLFLLVVAYFFIFKSFIGFKMLVSGYAKAAARYAGFSINSSIWLGLLVGGALAGLAGMTDVSGPAGQLTAHISNGYGFAAIIVAYVGRLHPVGIFFSGLLMALLYLGGEQAQHYLNLPSSIGRVFQGMLLFFLLGLDILVQYRIRYIGLTKKTGLM